MMIVERDAIYLAKLPKSVGLVSRIAPSHSRARAELRESEAPRDPFEFVSHETVVEADIMGDENAVPMNSMNRSATSANKGASRTISFVMPVSWTIFAG